METQRLILLFIFGFSVLMLWEAWQRETRPKPAPVAASQQQGVPAPKPVEGSARPSEGAKEAPAPGTPTAPAVEAGSLTSGELLRVTTDLVIAEIDTAGGTLKRLELLKHKDSADPTKNFVLLGPEHRYEAQSGLTSDGLNHRALWRAQPGNFALAQGQNRIEVVLTASQGGLTVEKVYGFKRNDYVIDVVLRIRNDGGQAVSPFAYFQLTHDGRPSTDANAVASTFGAQSFTGFAAYTTERKFEKVPPADIDKGDVDMVKQADNGWLAFVQHYFVSAWLPAQGVAREYGAVKRPDGAYAAHAVIPAGTLQPGAAVEVKAPLYAGPQEQRRLREAAPGLELVVDYGWLTIIAWPLFWLLEKFHELSGNWGVAIILLTILIKLIFFPLSAASYKSMAKMKLVTPRLTKIREMYGNDRQRMNQAMMELYKTEKINPLGGCFPILVQIPVFIALYWVLLAAIELRHAPFILWIKDLSALDPYYVLPILMAVTMVLQTKMNPVPPDPVQAKVMQFMPYVFSIFFFFFPAGLVLYWLVNNILSILQQWQIQRMFERGKPAHGKR
ncbi:MAG TPA: membrane protein insertase YidC [Burkholderiales bacterium]|nr:membrane protein insertase YidC [Burkholderiales bacterium]